MWALEEEGKVIISGCRGLAASPAGRQGPSVMGLLGVSEMGLEKGGRGRVDSHQHHWVQRGLEVLEGQGVPVWAGYECIRMGKEGRRGAKDERVGEQRCRQRAEGGAACT